MQRNPQTHRKWDYTAGVVLYAIQKVGSERRDTALLSYVKRNMDRWVHPDGLIQGYSVDDYSLDQISQGRPLFALYAQTRDDRYRKAAELLRSQLRTHPRTSEGGFWHKKIYPQQMWLDGLYMAEPFYAEYAEKFHEPAAFDDIARQFLLMTRHARDPGTNLLYHGWDATHQQKWADPLTGLSRTAWSRAIGWYVLGIVETLDHFPKSHPDRAAVIAALQNAAEGIARAQDPVTGLWWDVADQPNRASNYLEGSASAMFVYALAKGARLGYLDARYRSVAQRGFNGLLANLVRKNADGSLSLINIHQSAGLGGSMRLDGKPRDGSYESYATDVVVTDDYKGVGPIILAALELGR
jgi:unsaturated rhamnogalacturonyl hydrolase